MTFRWRTIAVALAVALLVASPAAAATSSFPAIPGQILQLTRAALAQLAGWLTGDAGASLVKSSTAVDDEDEGAEDMEGIAWDPDGASGRSR